MVKEIQIEKDTVFIEFDTSDGEIFRIMQWSEFAQAHITVDLKADDPCTVWFIDQCERKVELWIHENPIEKEYDYEGAS